MLQTGTVKKIELNDKDPLDLYAIQVYIPGNVNNQITAYPYDLSIQKVPLIGESVVLIQGKSATSNPGMRYQTTTYYYLNPISLQKNIHSNALPGGNILLKGAKTAAKYATAAVGVPGIGGGGNSELGDGFVERTDVASLQPFIGDVLLQGRFGHSMRFGFTPKSKKTSKKPSWSASKPEDPITIISNGRKKSGSFNTFIIEDVNDDLSSIWFTSSQKVKLKPAQKNIGKDTKNQSSFSEPTIILNSGRLFLNARDERVVITAKKDIVNSTPKWAMEMDKFFTLMEDLVSELVDLTSAKATYTTGVGPTGPATNAAKVKKIFDELKKMKQ